MYQEMFWDTFQVIWEFANPVGTPLPMPMYATICNAKKRVFLFSARISKVAGEGDGIGGGGARSVKWGTNAAQQQASQIPHGAATDSEVVAKLLAREVCPGYILDGCVNWSTHIVGSRPLAEFATSGFKKHSV